ncbi:MAG: hypothetical protein D3904_14390 [Candidatus Electrothrix sp. EH2]|nr:hypothetical protein [Candidatus Electrothrix sp. EH2]
MFAGGEPAMFAIDSEGEGAGTSSSIRRLASASVISANFSFLALTFSSGTDATAESSADSSVVDAPTLSFSPVVLSRVTACSCCTVSCFGISFSFRVSEQALRAKKK